MRTSADLLASGVRPWMHYFFECGEWFCGFQKSNWKVAARSPHSIGGPEECQEGSDC